MQALRFVTESVNHQIVIQLPPELDHQRLEVIVLPVGEKMPAHTAALTRRKPSPLLTGSVVMADDLIAPAVPERDWNALKYEPQDRDPERKRVGDCIVSTDDIPGGREQGKR